MANDLGGLAKVLSNLTAGTSIAAGHYGALLKASLLFAQMAAEKREQMTDAEWDRIFDDDDLARAALEEAINAKRQEGG